MKIELPEKLAIELNKIDWSKVPDKDINFLIKIGIPYLQLKGYLKKESKTNG